LKSIEAEKKIETHFQYMSECLQRRKEKLLNEIKTIYEKKCEMLNEQLEYFQSLPLTATNNIDISTNESIDFHITDIDSIKHHFIQDNENYLTTLIDNYGEILTTNVNSKQCTASGNGLVKCFMNKETTFTLTCRDTNSNMAKISLNFISISIDNGGDNTHCPMATRTCRVEPISEGLFVVRYAINKTGTYYMNILVNNEPIKNSPFKLYCVEYRSPESSSCLSREAKPIIINKSKTFHRLTALVKDQDTDISLSSSLHSTSITPTLKKLSSQSLKRDDLCFSIGSKGRLHARFLNPQSVYIHENENQIYVTDSTNKRVDVFSLSTDKNFEFKYSFSGNSVLKRPVGMSTFFVFNPRGPYSFQKSYIIKYADPCSFNLISKIFHDTWYNGTWYMIRNLEGSSLLARSFGHAFFMYTHYKLNKVIHAQRSGNQNSKGNNCHSDSIGIIYF
jgi:hypothetical protein